jgi:pimeloyl-ACP methyl ester carboxylesterase
MKTKLLIISPILYLYFLLNIFAQSPVLGHWEGAISIMGTELGMMVDIQPEGDSLKATIDIPMQNAFKLPLKNVRFNHPKIYFELPAGPGIAVFDGELKSDSIIGDFSQAGANGKFHLVKKNAEKSAMPAEPPPPYKEEEVKIKNGDVTFAGTLSIPESEGKHPAIILITGSGAQNRDEEIFGFKPFKIIADYLTRVGIAVLRCDDRGVGGSSGSMENATGEDFAKDVEAQVKYLTTRREIDNKTIGLLGHSEGGIVAPLVATRMKEISFLVLLASPAVSGDKIILKQIEFLARAGGATEDEIKKALLRQNQVYQVVRSNSDWAKLRADFKKDAEESISKMTADERKAMPDIENIANKSIDLKIKGIQSPWFKYFIDFDPAKQLEKIKSPVLALFGELDMQVLPDLNRKPMENALKKSGNKEFTIQIVPKANHLFQEAKTGNPNEYASLKKEFISGFMLKIADWIKDRTIEINKKDGKK